ncbi:MAG: P-loop NTPase fold protein [bacterium]
MNVKEPNFKFLDDAPVDIDDFRTHKNIADTIMNIVSNQTGGKAISLTGKWGSGKSSIVEMLKKKANKDDYGVFTFDSWQHEGDALKKAFLDELIDFSILKGWLTTKEKEGRKIIESEEFQKSYDILHQRYRSEHIKSSPHLTFWGKLFALLLLNLPIGLGLFTYGLGYFKDHAVLPTIFWCGLALVVSPMLIFTVLWIIRSGRKKKDAMCDDEADEMLAMFFNKKISRVITEKYETPDPSSIEFEQFFRDLLTLILNSHHKQNKKKIVIVIDNLDRVEEGTALDLLAAIKPFIQCNFRKSEECFENIWYIIPFDKNSLERLWEDHDSLSGSAPSFIDKIFQINLSIPPIIMKNWKQYFLVQLKKASSDYFTSHQKYEIRYIFEVLFNEKNSKNGVLTPTPRTIKLFINNFLASILLRLEIDYRAHSMFVGVREFFPDRFVNMRHLLVNVKKLPAYLKLISYYRELRNDLTALYFNVSYDEGMHVLLGKEVENAIVNMNLDFFSEHKDVSGMEEAIEFVMTDNAPDWMQHRPHILGNAANLFKEKNHLLNIIYKHAKEITNLKGLDHRSGKGFAVLVKKYKGDTLFKNKLLRILSNIDNNIIKEQEEDNEQ